MKKSIRIKKSFFSLVLITWIEKLNKLWDISLFCFMENFFRICILMNLMEKKQEKWNKKCEFDENDFLLFVNLSTLGIFFVVATFFWFVIVLSKRDPPCICLKQMNFLFFFLISFPLKGNHWQFVKLIIIYHKFFSTFLQLTTFQQ